MAKKYNVCYITVYALEIYLMNLLEANVDSKTRLIDTWYLNLGKLVRKTGFFK